MTVSVPDYDEFGLLHENAADVGLRLHRAPNVRRVPTDVGGGRHLSSLVWESAEPGLVMLHGGAQNAHTWDTMALALDRPLVAVDLPGHGHSDPGRNGSFTLEENAADLSVVVRSLAPRARCLVGMSLGGLLALAMADVAPDLVEGIVLVDITPGVTPAASAGIAAFVEGPDSFATFDEIVARAVEFYPGRTVESLRRGILHNAVRREDGRWVWRYARHANNGPSEPVDYSSLWATVARISVPIMLVRGMRRSSVVTDEDEAQFIARAAFGRVVRVESAGHGIQGDAPLELARLVDEFASSLP